MQWCTVVLLFMHFHFKWNAQNHVKRKFNVISAQLSCWRHCLWSFLFYVHKISLYSKMNFRPKGYSCKTSHMVLYTSFPYNAFWNQYFYSLRNRRRCKRKIKKTTQFKGYSSKRVLMQNFTYGVVYQIRQPDSISKCWHVVNVNVKIFKLKQLIE